MRCCHGGVRIYNYIVTKVLLQGNVCTIAGQWKCHS